MSRAQPPRNLEWGTMWTGSASGGANAFVTGLYNVIWCARSPNTSLCAC